MLQQVNKRLPGIYLVVLLVFFVSIFCDLRAVSSIGTIVLVAVALVGNKLATRRWWSPQYFNLFSAGCVLFLILQIVALLYTTNKSEGLKAIQLKSMLVAGPVLATYLLQVGPARWRRLMVWYTVTLWAATLYCLINATAHYIHTGDNSLFFYHPLVSVYSQHAVLYSIFVFVAIAFLNESFHEGHYIVNRWLHRALIVYFAGFLILLASKLIIVITACYFLYELVLRRRVIHSGRARLISLALIAATAFTLVFVKNPIRERFASEAYGKIDVIRQEKFAPSYYFTGTQFRLLQWRFTWEILNESGRWWMGVSPGDAQDYLNRKYVNTHMYTGGNGNNKNGFLGYNTHDQFLQSVLGNGIIGLLAFLAACAGLVVMAVRKKDIQLSFLVIIVIAYSFSESVFETQYDLVLFTVFPLLLYFRPFSYTPSSPGQRNAGTAG